MRARRNRLGLGSSFDKDDDGSARLELQPFRHFLQPGRKLFFRVKGVGDGTIFHVRDSSKTQMKSFHLMS